MTSPSSPVGADVVHRTEAAALLARQDRLRTRVLLTLNYEIKRPSEISETVSTPASVVSRILRSLVADGLVKTVPPRDLSDQRHRFYEITSGGRQALALGGYLAGTPVEERPVSHCRTCTCTQGEPDV